MLRCSFSALSICRFGVNGSEARKIPAQVEVDRRFYKHLFNAPLRSINRVEVCCFGQMEVTFVICRYVTEKTLSLLRQMLFHASISLRVGSHEMYLPVYRLTFASRTLNWLRKCFASCGRDHVNAAGVPAAALDREFNANGPLFLPQ